MREHATNVINFEETMPPLANNELKFHQDATSCYIRGKRFSKKFTNDKTYWKVSGHVKDKYRGAAHSPRNLKFNMPNEISAVFQNGSNHGQTMIIILS